MNHNSAERAKLQTVEEWLLEYSRGQPVMPGAVNKEKLPLQRTPLLRYHSHRTTKYGRLVMAFTDTETGQEVDVFFNVDIIKKRGEYKGTSYRTGLGGQFNVTPWYKFYKFWMDAVGKEPTRWCRVHKEMKSKLENLIFTGELSTGHRKDGSPFIQIKNLHKLDTTEAQTGHILDTTKAQLICTTS